MAEVQERYFAGLSVVKFSSRKLAALLDERKLTPYALAQRLHPLTHSWIQRLLAGEIRMPREANLLRIAQELGVDYAALLEDLPGTENDHLNETRGNYLSESPQAQELHLLVSDIASKGEIGRYALEALAVVMRAQQQQVNQNYEEQLRVQRLERKRAKQAAGED